jgi:hypothetical protein
VSTDTTAETIRRAAALMRERAEAATPGPWWSDEDENCWRLHGVAFRTPPALFPDGSVMIPEQIVNKQIAKAPKHRTPYAEYWPDAADDAHITSWHPLVALAVAVWLDIEATIAERGLPDDSGSIHPALTVARAYLGDVAP